MDALSLHIKYRPLRIGWCVRQGDFDALRSALRLSHILWGGRYNPVIPVDNREFAAMLVQCFRTDVLYPSSNDRVVQEFIAGFPYLRAPMFLFPIVVNERWGPPYTQVLDIQHPVGHLRNRQASVASGPSFLATIYSWDSDDPLADFLLATFGAFPPKDEIGIDFAGLMERELDAVEHHLQAGTPLPSDAFHHVYPSKVTSYLLEREPTGGWHRAEPGFYIGSCGDFADIVNYWNLRACNLELMFFDPGHSGRLSEIRDAWRQRLDEAMRRKDPLDARVALWSKTGDTKLDAADFSRNAITRAAQPAVWQGVDIVAPMMHFKEHSVLAMLTEDAPPKVVFQLPGKPFLSHPQFTHQHMVVSVRPVVDIWAEHLTLRTPYVPELNEHYGRRCYFRYDHARAEPAGLGIVTHIADADLTLNALNIGELVIAMLESFGIAAQPSLPGRVCTRLIQQMRGLQGCRVFKIAGVRELIEKYGPDESFTRSAAVQLIGRNDPNTGHPDFAKYEDLCIESGQGFGKLKPERCFLHLVGKGVFQVGLKLRCPRCELEFWRRLDDVKSQSECEYCGTTFDVTTQLRDREWAYRRSGLFGRKERKGEKGRTNKQEGSIAVAVALQQLDTVLSHDGKMLYTTAMELSGRSDGIDKCETDLVIVVPIRDNRAQVLIAECKTGGRIDEEDVLNLAKVADALPERRFETFVLFAKLAPFTPDEVELCRKAQGQDAARVILLSDRELEPYGVYEWAEKEFHIRGHAFGLQDMAQATIDIYLDPKPRKPEQS